MTYQCQLFLCLFALGRFGPDAAFDHHLTEQHADKCVAGAVEWHLAGQKGYLVEKACDEICNRQRASKVCTHR